jgi:hypothetical protein
MAGFDNAYDVERNMTNHPPASEVIVERYEYIRAEFKELATLIDQTCPASREKLLAFTNLEQALMWSVASIARDGH